MEATDNSDIHGGLIGLTKISLAYQETETGDCLEIKKREVGFGTCYAPKTLLMFNQLFRYLSHVPETTLLGPRNEMVTAAACDMITQTITLSEINLGAESAVSNWRKIVDHGLKHRDMIVQEAATITMGAISSLVDCSSIVLR